MFFLLSSIYLKDTPENILKDFVNKDIKIFNSAYSYQYLAEDTNGDPIMILESRFYNQERLKANSVARLIADRKGYYIKLGDSYMCVGKGQYLNKCEDDKYDSFTLSPKTFGWVIKQDDKCLTAVSFNKVKMEICVDDVGQVFDFKLHTTMSKCAQMAKELEKKENERDREEEKRDQLNNQAGTVNQDINGEVNAKETPVENPIIPLLRSALSDPETAKAMTKELVKSVSDAIKVAHENVSGDEKCQIDKSDLRQSEEIKGVIARKNKGEKSYHPSDGPAYINSIDSFVRNRVNELNALEAKNNRINIKQSRRRNNLKNKDNQYNKPLDFYDTNADESGQGSKKADILETDRSEYVVTRDEQVEKTSTQDLNAGTRADKASSKTDALDLEITKPIEKTETAKPGMTTRKHTYADITKKTSNQSYLSPFSTQNMVLTDTAQPSDNKATSVQGNNTSNASNPAFGTNGPSIGNPSKMAFNASL